MIKADIKAIKKFNDVETLESFLPNVLNSHIEKEDEYARLKPDTLLKLLEIL